MVALEALDHHCVQVPLAEKAPLLLGLDADGEDELHDLEVVGDGEGFLVHLGVYYPLHLLLLHCAF